MGEFHRLNLAVIGIDQHGNLGEREKRYPDGEEDVEQGDSAAGDFVDRNDEKIDIFEKAEQQQIEGKIHFLPPFPGLLRIEPSCFALSIESNRLASTIDSMTISGLKYFSISSIFFWS